MLLGVLIGLFATAFRVAWLEADAAVWGTFTAGYHRIWISTLAGMLIGIIMHWSFYPGSLATIVRHFHRSGRIPFEDNKPIVPSGLIGLVAGQSAGPEGVMSQVGGSFGTKVADKLGYDGSGKILTLAGMGAGFGSILGAPIGGGILWLELPHERGMEYYEAIVPTLVASFAGYLTMAMVGGLALFPAWQASVLVPLRTTHLVFAIGIGLLCIPFAIVYTRIFELVGELFGRWSPQVYVRTTVAGLVIGLLGYAIPLTYFYGGKQINEILTGTIPFFDLVAILGGTMLAASVTINGNWQGGLIIPHMFMGAVIGRAASLVVPGLEPALAMLAGMAAFNSTVTGTPLASALIAIALTDGASIVPVFLASLTAFVASPIVRIIDTEEPRKEQPGFHLGRE